MESHLPTTNTCPRVLKLGEGGRRRVGGADIYVGGRWEVDGERATR